jgi:hypothetical protein
MNVFSFSRRGRSKARASPLAYRYNGVAKKKFIVLPDRLNKRTIVLSDDI